VCLALSNTSKGYSVVPQRVEDISYLFNSEHPALIEVGHVVVNLECRNFALVFGDVPLGQVLIVA